jgi:hypothetical protein
MKTDDDLDRELPVEISIFPAALSDAAPVSNSKPPLAVADEEPI